MAGLLGNYDDEPQGLLGNIRDTLTSPLGLGGLALLTGQGFGGAMQGMQMGAAFDAQRRKRALDQQTLERYGALFSNPSIKFSLPPSMIDILSAAGPEVGYPLLAKYSDPDRALTLETQRANLAKTKAETAHLGQNDAINGIVMNMLNGGGLLGVTPDAAGNDDTHSEVGPGLIPQSVPVFPTRPSPLLIGNDGNDGTPSIWSTGVTPAADLRNDRTAEPVPNASTNSGAPAWYRTFAQPKALPPGIQLAADTSQTPAAVPGRNRNPAPEQDIINTPYGPMTRQKALQFGGALMLNPQFSAAGKAIVDAAQSPTSQGMTKPTVNALQERQLNATEQFSRLKSIEFSWKPEYQTIEKRLGFAWNALVDKFGSARKSLTNDQKQELAAYSANRAEGLNNLNQYIKEITGAAMTNAEALRIRNSMPDPGEGIFDGDSPTVFDAKLQANIRLSKMALARYAYLSKHGFSDVEEMSKAIPLEKMGDVIQQRTDQILKDTMSQNPDLTPEQVRPIVRQRLRAEFGIDA